MDCPGRVMLTKHPLWWPLDEWLACSHGSPWAACLVVIMTLESSVPLPSLGRFHSFSHHSVTTDTVQRERSTYSEKRESKDAAFLSLHSPISQTSIGLWRMDRHSRTGNDENQLVLMSRGWKYPEYSHGRDGERGRSCFSERAGAWVDPPRRALLGSSVQFSCSVLSDSLWPHESQHTMTCCPSPNPGVHPDSSPSWRRQWHPTPVLLPGKSHGQRSLVGCSP